MHAAYTRTHTHTHTRAHTHTHTRTDTDTDTHTHTHTHLVITIFGCDIAYPFQLPISGIVLFCAMLVVFILLEK